MTMLMLAIEMTGGSEDRYDGDGNGGYDGCESRARMTTIMNLQSETWNGVRDNSGCQCPRDAVEINDSDDQSHADVRDDTTRESIENHY